MRVVSVDISNVKGRLDRYFSRCVGAGRAAEVMRHVAYEQLRKMQKECPFEYIRFHGLFHDEMAVVTRDEDGKLQFNFQYVDLLFDSLLEVNIRPVVELGLMPETMASKDAHVFWWKMNISPAKDTGEWYALVEALVRHVTHRYGEEEIKKWYFEVWNEPNLEFFFSESHDVNAYLDLYEAAARAVKSVCVDYQVGGPSSAGFYWINEMIAARKERQIPLDFLSSHQYNVDCALDLSGKKLLQLRPKERFWGSVRKWGARCHEEGLPFLLTEWSASSGQRDPIHDSYFEAPFILEQVKRCEGAVEMFSHWTYTDIFEEMTPPYSLFHGGFGLTTVRSIPKPSYYAYRFLAALGDTELCCEDEACYACHSENEVQVLLWNCVNPDQGDLSNQVYFGRDLPAKVLEDAEVVLSGLEAGKEYAITVETLGYRMGDCYTAYLDMGSPAEPTREETAELCRKAEPKKTTLHLCADGEGKLILHLPQSENQADLVRVTLA